ncbi:MAG: S41 family peptidase [Dehalococcoidia bacterium]|jgi:carboxyl-terminal processing protease
MPRAAKWSILGLLIAALAGLSFALGVAVERNHGGSGSQSAQTAAGAPDFDALNEIYGLLQKYYVDPSSIDGQTLSQAAINGMVKSLSDTGTYYIDPQTYATSVMPSGTFEGIGATVAEQNGKIVITAPIAGTPAEQAGILSGDIILEVNGESTDGWTVEKAVSSIRGPKGTEVTLKVQHSDGQVEEITLKRDEIEVASVSHDPPMGAFKDSAGNDVTDLAYIQIREFTALTEAQLKPEMDRVASGNYKGLILDLRNNPGGLLDTTVHVADMFLDSGTILIQVDRDGTEKTFSATSGGPATTIPLVILVNKFSASGSEVLSAALHDNGRATLIGENTFGKGTVNIPQQLSDDRGALFVTIARWLTPKRVLIDGVGIKPDIAVTLSDDDVSAHRDTQLSKAIDFLRGNQ